MVSTIYSFLFLFINWVKGHADNPFNNRCYELATQAADGMHLQIDEGYEKSI